MKKHYISLDWGGSNLSGICAGSDCGSVTFKMPSENVRFMNDGSVRAVVKKILEVSKAPSAEQNIWLIGAAGAGSKTYTDMIIKAVKAEDQNCGEVKIYTDYQANHAACFGGKDGILFTSGTGSVLFGKRGGQELTVGGCGYLIDRLPSGSLFGRMALEGLCKALNGFTEYEDYYDAALELKLIEKKDRREVKTELIDNLYASTNPQQFVSKFAYLFVELLRTHECSAIKDTLAIFDNLTVAVGDLLSVLYKDEYTSRNVRVDLCGVGGMWENFMDFGDLALTAFEHAGCSPNFCNPQYELFCGPLVLYSKECSEVNDILKGLKKTK